MLHLTNLSHIGTLGRRGSNTAPQPDFFIPLTSSLALSRGVGSPTFTRNTTATVWGYDNSGNWTLLTIPSGVPRFEGARWTGSAWTDTFPDGSKIPDETLKGYLAEGQRTNYLLNSDTLVTQNVTVTAQAYTLSFSGTGTVTLSGTYSGSIVGTGESNRVQFTLTPTAGTLIITVSGTCTNGQLEVGGFASSYISTSLNTVTRNLDKLTYPITPGSQGSAYLEFILNGGISNNGESLLGSPTVNRQMCTVTSTHTQTYDGINQSNNTNIIATVGTMNKYAISWASKMFSFLRGVKGNSPSNFDGSFDTSSLSVGYSEGFVFTDQNTAANIKNVKIWNKPLMDTQLINMTR